MALEVRAKAVTLGSTLSQHTLKLKEQEEWLLNER